MAAGAMWSWGRGRQGLKQRRRKGRERSKESRKRTKAWPLDKGKGNSAWNRRC